MKPAFVPRGQRTALAAIEAEAAHEADLNDTEKARQDRRARARSLVAEYTQRDQERLSAAAPLPFNGVDDTDGLDPETEALEWQLRSLQRLQREQEQRARIRTEQAEVERIRALPEEERARLAAERAAAAETGEGQYGFLQKYYHKGAFFQDADEAIYKRDFTEPTYLDKQSKDALPASMQVRDYGKRSRSKWTHLTAEDTTAFDYGWGAKDNRANYATISKMGGMRPLGDSKKPKHK